MSRPPSHSSPSSGYARLDSHPHQPPPPAHHPSPQYAHSSPGGHSYPHDNPTPPIQLPADRDPYHKPPHSGDQHYYPQPSQPSAEYRYQRPPLPPPPHPPAPPAPPRPPPSYRKPYQELQGGDSPRPTLVPTFNYYRAHVEYNSQNAPPHVDNERTLSAPRQDDARARSVSSGSGYGSGMHEHAEGEMEATPSPVDPGRIRQWEEEHTQGQSHHTSSRPGSHQGGDEGEGDTIHPGPHHGVYSPSLGQGESSVDDGRRGGRTDPGTASLAVPYPQKRPNFEYYPSPHHQVQFQALAQVTGTTDTQRGNIGLNSLVDAGDPDGRPAYPIPTIIKCAILGSPHQQLTLSELYLAMEMRFEYYRNSDKNKKSWRNSVRHNLSLNNQFDKKERPITEPGKGHYWVVVPDMPQGNKRERKRNKKPGKRALAAMAADAERVAREQEGDENSTSPSYTESPLDAQPSTTTVVYPGPIRGYTTGTLPANAGSYAAVTGALPAPPPLDRQLFRPWDGDASLSDPGTSASARHDVQRPASAAHSDHSPRSSPSRHPGRQVAEPKFGELSLPRPSNNSALDLQSGESSLPRSSTNTASEPQATEPQFVESSLPRPSTSVAPEPRAAEPQFGESSLRPPEIPPFSRRPEGTTPIPRHCESASTGSSNSSDHDRPYSPTMWSRRRYDQVGPLPTAPQNAFAELAAQIERDGIGATGSGGPALTTRKKRKRKDLAMDDEWDSEGDDLSDDDDYLPHRTRFRRRLTSGAV